MHAHTYLSHHHFKNISRAHSNPSRGIFLTPRTNFSSPELLLHRQKAAGRLLACSNHCTEAKQQSYGPSALKSAKRHYRARGGLPVESVPYIRICPQGRDSNRNFAQEGPKAEQKARGRQGYSTPRPSAILALGFTPKSTDSLALGFRL